MQMQTTEVSPVMASERQLAPDNVPRFQKTIERACGSRAVYDRNPAPLRNNALTAMPSQQQTHHRAFSELARL